MRVVEFKSLRILVWLFAITLNNWILSVFLNLKLLKRSGSISDFSALSQPHHLVFRSLDIIAGGLIILISLILFSEHRKSRLGSLISGGALLLGVANIVDALVPLACTNIIDSSCQATVSLDINHLVLPRHIYSSVAIGFCILLMPLASWFYARRLNSFKLTRISGLALFSATIFIAALGIGLITGSHRVEDIASYSQYTQMLLLGWWYIEWSKIHERFDHQS